MKLPRIATGKLPRGGLWAACCVLLLLGCVSSVLSLMQEGGHERTRALAVGQRLVFNAKTGAEISHRAAPKADAADDAAKAAFDVAADEESEAGAPTTPPPAAATADAASGTASKPAPEAPAAASDIAYTRDVLRSEPAAALGKIERTDESLVPAPAPEITEHSKFGDLPKISGSSMPSKLYARHAKVPAGSMSLAVVVMGLGFSNDALHLALTLPNDISLGFSPYAPGVKDTIAALRDAGHEAWIAIPAQNADYPATDPGPLGMIASLPAAEVKNRLSELLARSPGAVGGIFAPDETLSEFPAAMRPVLQEFADRGMFMLFTEPKRVSSLPPMPPKLKARVVDMVLPANATAASINSKLAGLIDATQVDGTYMLAVQGTPQMLKLLKSWTEKLPKESPVKLVPISALFEKDRPKKAPAPKEGEKPAGKKGEKKAEKKH